MIGFGSSKMALAAALVAAVMATAWVQPARGQDDFDMAGVQLWNCDYWQTVSVGDFMGPNYEYKKLKPIEMAGARNGTYSGYVVLTNSNGPINGLKATATELATADGAKLAAANIRVRYPQLASEKITWTPVYRFDSLLEQAPDVVEIVYFKNGVRGWKPKQPGPVATQPIWVTVSVPKDAKPGVYEGKLAVEAESLAVTPMEVPIRLTVHDYQLPDAKDFSLQNLAWYSPERVAQFYKVPMWSDKHIALCGQSLALMRQVGSGQVFVNLVVRYPSQDNTETMVTWVKQPDGSFKYDFTAFDRYLDVVAATIGKPFPLRLNMWTVPGKDPKLPQVVVLDAKTGQRSLMDQPFPIGSEESYKFWKPVLDEIRTRVEKRGWFDVTGVNWHEYCGGPTPEAVSMLHKIWPDGKWTDLDHGRRTGFSGVEPGVQMPVLVQSCVWNEGSLQMRGYKKDLKAGVAFLGHARGRHRDSSPLWDMRCIDEEQLMKGNHGIDPLGADLWPIRDKHGRYLPGAWAAAALGPGNCTQMLIAPGPKGPVATERYEAFREGVQIAETILFVQRALNAGKLDGELAAKANKLLDDRSKRMIDSWPTYDSYGHRRFHADKFAVDGLQRDSDLYALAAEVAKASGQK